MHTNIACLKCLNYLKWDKVIEIYLLLIKKKLSTLDILSNLGILGNFLQVESNELHALIFLNQIKA